MSFVYPQEIVSLPLLFLSKLFHNVQPPPKQCVPCDLSHVPSAELEVPSSGLSGQPECINNKVYYSSNNTLTALHKVLHAHVVRFLYLNARLSLNPQCLDQGLTHILCDMNEGINEHMSITCILLLGHQPSFWFLRRNRNQFVILLYADESV